MDFAKIKYVVEHRKAFRKVARDLGCMKIRYYFHDLDKIFMLLFLDARKVSSIHRSYSKHHLKASSKNDYIEMAIDWECARFTKPDKPFDAYSTLMIIYPSMIGTMLPILKELNLVEKENDDE